MTLVTLPPTPRRKLGSLTALLHCIALVAALLSLSTYSLAKPKVHTVYEGQRLGSIAKRYNVTVDALCQANGISTRSPIRPGQKLIIPGTDDGTGTSNAGGSADKSKPKEEAKRSPSTQTPAKPQGKTQVHIVSKGHTLSAVAGRYQITVSALCNANDLSRTATLDVGQKLIIPHKTDRDGAYARKQKERGDFNPAMGETPKTTDKGSETKKTAPSIGPKSWEPYVRPAWKRGYIKIRRYGRYWEGYVIGTKGEVLGQASNKINFVLGASSTGPHIEPKLIRLIASISDKFGGRELRIVSGYRTKSFVAASQHKKGRALDFSIPSIPNEVLCDYLRTLDEVGVGYYPNSSFVHVDVRGYNSYWVDYAGPGEAPRKSTASKGKSKKGTSGESSPTTRNKKSSDKPSDVDSEDEPSNQDDQDEPAEKEQGEDDHEGYSHGESDPEDADKPEPPPDEGNSKAEE